MNLIRYAIGKTDLHKLLRSLGVLQQSERLLAVENTALVDETRDQIVITVTEEALPASDAPLTELTDKELNERHAKLDFLYNLHQKELTDLAHVITSVRHERERRSSDSTVSIDGIPVVIDKNLTDQIRTILSSGDEHSSSDI